MKKKEKKVLILLVILLVTIGIAIGYAVLTDQLKVKGSVNYETIKMDVGFSTTEDGGGTVSSSSSISEDKKSITITCDLGTSSLSETCITKAVINNGSTFAIELDENPTIEFDNTYINSVTATWVDDAKNVEAGNSINKETTKELEIKIVTKELSKEMLPNSQLSMPVTITMNWSEKK